MNRRQLLGTAALCASTLSAGKVRAGGPEDQDPDAAASSEQIKELGLEVLVDDAPRQNLFTNVASAAIAEDADKEAQTADLTGAFNFPGDVDFDRHLKQSRTAVFGVDISHYTGHAFPIELLRSKKVRFLYMKATQGTRYVDDHFASFWKRAGALPPSDAVHRGAYHFLSCGDPDEAGRAWGAKQAKTFVTVLRANGGLRKTDMPPVVDLEWDLSSNNPDRWSQREPDDIIEVVLGFLEQVKTDLNVTPMIYTARSWWRGRIGNEAKISKLADYPLWGADYSRSAQASEDPKTIRQQKWALWQFSASARLNGGFNRGFDANIFKGDEDAFYKTFPVARFA